MELSFRKPHANNNIEAQPVKHEVREAESDVTFKERIKHFTWAWFAFPLSTHGVSLVLSATPHRFAGLTVIGEIFYIFAIVVFITSVAAITTRFILTPLAFKRSITHPTEALFVPTFTLNLALVVACAQVYGVPHCGTWLLTAVRVLFWLFVAIAFIACVVHYLHLFTAPATRLTIQSMTPAWILPIFPIMLGGTLANIIAPDQSPAHRAPIIFAGITFQGLGWMVAFLMYAVYIHRLMQYGLPNPNLRPGMFIAVGPPSFTGLALIGLSKSLAPDYGYFAGKPTAVEMAQTAALMAGVFLWALGFWFFCIALLAVLWDVKKMCFHLVWWAFIFPNAGFVIATTTIGEQLESQGILWVASAMTILIVTMYLFILCCTIRAVFRKDILMPGKDEDKEFYKEDDEKHGIPVPP